jgi:hypothetical protein
LNPATFTNKTYNVETLLIISIACCGSPKLSSEILMLRRNLADMDFKCRKKNISIHPRQINYKISDPKSIKWSSF